MILTTVMWSVILAVTFEFSRTFKSYDYRTFFKKLLGKYWFVFEIFYLYAMLLVLAVVGSAAGVLFRDNFGIPYLAGVMIMLIVIGFHTFKGSAHIEKFLVSWSMILYSIYGIIFIVTLYKFGPIIQKNITMLKILPGWHLAGFKYALYNFNVMPAALFCLRHIETRKEAVCAGLFAGVIAIFPGLLFMIAVISQYPAFLTEEIPIVYLLNQIGSTFLLIIFQIVLFGTLIETGTSLIHSVNERIQSFYHDIGKEFSRRMRPVVSVIFILIGLGISSFGLINLIAKGYGSSSWGFLVIFVIPLFTLGVYKISKQPNP